MFRAVCTQLAEPGSRLPRERDPGPRELFRTGKGFKLGFPVPLPEGDFPMTRWLRLWSALPALLMLALPLAGQVNGATRGGLGGVVYDSAGAVMPGITVDISGPQGDYQVKSEANGRFEVNGLVPGSYKVTVEAPGFKKFVSEHNLVVVDHTSSLDVRLDIGS